MNKDKHLGTYIKNRVKEKGITVSEFARRIHCTRRNIYQIYKKNSLDTDLIKRISLALEIDLLSTFNKSSFLKLKNDVQPETIEKYYEKSIKRLNSIENKLISDKKLSNETVFIVNNILTLMNSIQLNIQLQINTLNELMNELEKKLEN
jgi:transcriptional regulator with XRE-family HTH domain